MTSPRYYRLRVKTFLLAMITVIATLIAGVVVVSAVDPFPGLPNDGRINVVHHFGGDALYCMTSAGVPTDDYDNTAAMRMLNINGTELWSVPMADIEAAIALAQATPGTGVEVFTGPGTYGPASLYATADANGTITFTFIANDEWYKTNTMTFEGCGPVGPISADNGPACSGLDGEEFEDCADLFCLIESGCYEAAQEETLVSTCDVDAYFSCLEDFGIDVKK